jgi:hypothetical protein
VVIDLATRRQIGGLFDCQELGTIALKGLEPVPAWQVLSVGTAEGRFEALRGTITALVGRDEEMDLLLRRWAQAKAGSGKVVLISADAGVGNPASPRRRPSGSGPNRISDYAIPSRHTIRIARSIQ